LRVEFAANQMQRFYERYEQGARKWGETVARKYIQRINILQAAQDFQHLSGIRSLRLHPLKGDRRGQWAIDLHDRWRLIVTPLDNPSGVRVEEVSQHYDD
jgi:proteic killer suppression protein